MDRTMNQNEVCLKTQNAAHLLYNQPMENTAVFVQIIEEIYRKFIIISSREIAQKVEDF